MLSRSELKEISSLESKDGWYVSFYLNVDPVLNRRGDFIVHAKNMVKDKMDSLDKAVLKSVRADFEKIDAYVLSNKRLFKRGLVLLCSGRGGFWREYHLGVPVRNELVVDRMPYIKPLLDVLDTHERYVILLVDKESARIMVVHLGEIVEYGEVHTPDVPGKHKKGGWFALSQNKYERHTEVHVTLHLKDVIDRLNSFMVGEHIGRIMVGGSDEAVSMAKGMLHASVLEKVIGSIKIEMFARTDEVLKKVEPLVASFEKKQEETLVETVITKARKNEGAVLGLDDVLNALQEQRVMTLVVPGDYKTGGHMCRSCGSLSRQEIQPCPYCKGDMVPVDDIISLAGQRALQQGAGVEFLTESTRLLDAGTVGALLRF
jgi:peptide chain release factor subunit 1